MGNQTSFLCCHAPSDKYEAAKSILAEATEKGGSLEAIDTAAVPADTTGGGQGDGTSGKGNKQAEQQPAPFSTTDPLQVAAELAPQQGLPYKFHVCGPPLPPCDEMRLRTINALKSVGSVRMDADAIDAPPDPEIASILKLVQSIFEAPAALVALFDDRRIFIRDAEGAFKRGDFPWRWSFCGWTMASKNDQIMVIPDATKDARFCNNAMVKSGPGVRFYCGTPLIASNGHRIGTLCFADTKPREFDASRCVVLNNLAELVVRHLEKDIALQLRAHDNNTLIAAYGNLRRTLDCFDHCVILLDTSTPGWRILFVNNPCCKALGIERESLQGSYLSRLLAETDGSMLPADDHQREADLGREFTVEARLSGVVIEEIAEKGGPADKDKDKSAVDPGAQRFLLTFRPASREDLDQGQIPIGVPNWIPATPKALPDSGSAGLAEGEGRELQAAQRRTDTLYFMLLQDAVKLEAERQAAQAKAAAEAKAAAASSTANLSTAHSSLLSVSLSHDRELSQPPESISGLSMGHLLGKGAYGSVYYGTWYGSPVAVKIIDEELPPGAESVGPPIEAILSKELRHPHIVATLRCARRVISPSGSSHAASASTASLLANLRRGVAGGASGATRSGGAGASGASGSGPAGRSRLAGGDGSMEAFSDDTARVSRATTGIMSPAGGSTGGGGAPVIAAPPPRPGAGDAAAAAAVGFGADSSSARSGGAASTSTGACGGTATGTATARTGSVITTTSSGMGGPAGGPSGTASSTGTMSPSGGSSGGAADAGGSGADKAVIGTAIATSEAQGQGEEADDGGAPQQASLEAQEAQQPQLAPPGLLASAASTATSTSQSSGWAIINLEAGGQRTRRRSSATRHSPAAAAAIAMAAAAAAEEVDGAAAGGLEPPLEERHSSGSEGTSNDVGSEAYDEFDAGRDSCISPFLLPPGSGQGGGGAGGLGASGGAGGPSGLPYHSGPSAGASGKWVNDEVLIRHQTWLIMEYCDRGCLQDAIDRGWLRASPSLESSGPRLDAVLATAVELASALSFLHAKDIVHGDLSAWNVMLCTSGATAPLGGRNFVAKIADFGLARHLDIRTKIQTRTYGTLTHMPAETLRDGMISKATDVYSLGVLLWQLYTSSRPWAGLRHGQIIVMVVTQGARLRFPPGCPPAYEELAMACTEPDARRRPAIEAVLAELESIRRGLV